MSRLMVASVALAVAAAACGDDTRGAGGSGAGGAMSVPQGSGGSAPAGDTTPSSSAEGPSTTADASTGASTDGGWECFIQGDGCQCDQLGFDYDLEDCGDWVCCVAYPDSGDGASCLCGDDQAVCNDLLEIDAGASPSASCPP